VASPDGRRDRALLGAALAAAFAISAVSDLRTLLACGAAALLLFRRGAARALRRVARAVLPLAGGAALASALWLRVAAGAWPPLAPFAAVALRAAVLAFVTLSVLGRVNLPRAAAPSPTVSRLLALTLAQLHALRLLAGDSLLGLRSRLLRRPRAVDVARGAGGISASLFTLSMRNAREISDAMRARGFR
jgi:cobalt/nickel transport system permease protein